MEWLCWLALWPGFWHLKHSFSLIQQACSAGVNLVKETASTSMVFGLQGGFLDMKKGGFPFLPLMAAMCIFYTWKVLAFSIHLFNMVGMVDMERIMVAICWLIPREKC